MLDSYLGVIALLDEKANTIIENINDTLKKEEIKTIDIPPHITLGLYKGVKTSELQEWACKVFRDTKKIKLYFNHIGLFGLDVVFLAPMVTTELLLLHKKLHAKYDDKHGDLGKHYSLKYNSYVPHVSLVVNDDEQVLRAIPIVSKNFKPFEAEVVSIGLYTFYPMKEIQLIELK